MYFSRPFCLICPDFKKRRYKDYEYLENKKTGDITARFTTPLGKDIKCQFNIKTGDGYKRVWQRGYIIECSYRNFKPEEATMSSMDGMITKNFVTGLTSIMSHDNNIEHGITKDGQVIDLNTEKMYKFWKKLGFYKMPTMHKVKAVMKKIKSCRKF